jgi:hypothetical protein
LKGRQLHSTGAPIISTLKDTFQKEIAVDLVCVGVGIHSVKREYAQVRDRAEWQARGREHPTKAICRKQNRCMLSMALHYCLSTTTFEMTVHMSLCGSKRSRMTGEGNASMAPSPVASVPGELTIHVPDEQLG